MVLKRIFSSRHLIKAALCFYLFGIVAMAGDEDRRGQVNGQIKSGFDLPV